MSENLPSATNRLVGIAILGALVVVLQVFAGFFSFGAFSISLVLVPIVIGAALYGPGAGALLGGAFGTVVLINCINGSDVGGSILWTARPFITAILCLFKGIMAGYGAGIAYRLLAKKNSYFAALIAAFVSPVVNTGIFLCAMFLFYRPILLQWAGDSALLVFLFVGLAGVNFLLELAVNLLLSPGIVRIIDSIAKKPIDN